MTDDFMGVSACPICGGPLDNRNPISHRCTGVPDARRRQIDEEYDIVREQMRDERIAILDEVRRRVKVMKDDRVNEIGDERILPERYRYIKGHVSALHDVLTIIDAMKEER